MVTRQGTGERVAKNYREDAEGPAYINSSGDCESKEAVPTVRRESSWGASDGSQEGKPQAWLSGRTLTAHQEVA